METDWRDTTFADRLEHVRREIVGVETYADFRRHLVNDGFDVHYNSVVNYHSKAYERDPSLDYLRRVSEVFGIRMEWLVNGTLPVTYDQELAERGAASDAAPDVAKGFSDGLGVQFEGLTPGTRAVLLQTWAVAMPRKTLPTYSTRYGSHEKRTARMIGKALSEPLRTLDIQPVGDAPEAFVSAVSLALAQLLRAEVAPWPAPETEED